MSRLGRIRRRLATELRTRGLLATVVMVLRYVRWRLYGSPAPVKPTLADWLRSYDALGPEVMGSVRFSIVCPVHDTPASLLEQCVRSVRSQTYSKWELMMVDDASTKPETVAAIHRLARRDQRVSVITLVENVGIAEATNAGARVATGEYLVFLDHDDLLAPNALAWLSTCVPKADVIYSDEDKVFEDGAHDHGIFKPAWSPRLLLGVNYINHVTCVRASVFAAIGGLRAGVDGVQDHDLLLRLSEQQGLTVAHLPNVLYHWRAWAGSAAGQPHLKREIEAAGLRIVGEAIERRGWNAHAGLGNGSPLNYRVFFDAEPESPLVKVVIPTRDRLRLLRVAVDGVLTRTDGVRTHVVIVDNGSRDPKVLRYLDALQREREDVSVHTVDDGFNFSRLCNEGIRVGPEAPLVLLLNNDVEIWHRRWLLQLTGWLRDPAVIAAGPKLLFPDRTIQHAGVVLGLGGVAGHYAGYQANQPRAGSLHDQAREVACLTAACLLLRSADYHAVGGMNEDLPTDFQDVDFCLRLRRDLAGSLMYDPTFPLVHLQSATRGDEGASGYTVSRMQFLWGEQLAAPDPYYSPHLTLKDHDGSLAQIPADAELRRSRLQARRVP